MNWTGLAGALTATMLATSAYAMDDAYLAAFVRATDSPPPNVQAVMAAINQRQRLDDIAKQGVLKSPYDCLPEIRPLCHDVLVNITRGGGAAGSPGFDWGERFEEYAGDVAGQKEFAQRMVDLASQRGFNLLTNEELKAVVD